MTISSLIHNLAVVVEEIQEKSLQIADELENLIKNIVADPDTYTKITMHHCISSLAQESANIHLKIPAPHISMVIQRNAWPSIFNGIRLAPMTNSQEK